MILWVTLSIGIQLTILQEAVIWSCAHGWPTDGRPSGLTPMLPTHSKFGSSGSWYGSYVTSWYPTSISVVSNWSGFGAGNSLEKLEDYSFQCRRKGRRCIVIGIATIEIVKWAYKRFLNVGKSGCGIDNHCGNLGVNNCSKGLELSGSRNSKTFISLLWYSHWSRDSQNWTE